MVEIPFFLLEALFALAWLAARTVLWILRGWIDWKREAVLLLMYVNLAVLIRFTFFPMDRADGRVQPLAFDAAAAFPFKINLVPLVKLLDYESRRDLLLNTIGNAAMFVPTGIILPVVYRRLDTFGKVLAAGAGISLCIELLQLPFSVRTSDVDDLLLNLLGVIAGYGIYTVLRPRKRTKPRSRAGIS